MSKIKVLSAAIRLCSSASPCFFTAVSTATAVPPAATVAVMCVGSRGGELLSPRW
jgi:hypothetical protein